MRDQSAIADAINIRRMHCLLVSEDAACLAVGGGGGNHLGSAPDVHQQETNRPTGSTEPLRRWRWSSSSAGRSMTSPARRWTFREAAFPARPDRPGPVRASIRADPDQRLDRRPARPAAYRPRRDPARTALRADPVRLATWAGFISLPILFGVAALLGVARAFAGPALGAMAPNLVPREILPNAIALSSTAWQTGAIVGPAIGGILYDVTPHLPYALSAALFAFSRAVPVHHRPDAAHRRSKPGQPAAQMVDGLAYVRRNRLVLGAITLDLFAVLLGGVTAMLPVYARDILQVGADGLGPLRAAPAAARR